MSLLLDLPNPIESRLRAEATKAGVSLPEYITELITKNLPSSSIDPEEQKRLNTPSVVLLEEWLKRTQVPTTLEQTATAEAELAEFMRQANVTRQETGERLLYPDIDISTEDRQGKP